MTFDEYNAKFAANTRIEGYGLDVAMSYPCPACAEPDFVTAKVIETRDVLSQEHICKHCKRGFKTAFTPLPGGGFTFGLVQTAGDDMPDYMPQARREEPA